jgi:hypothetical protein
MGPANLCRVHSLDKNKTLKLHVMNNIRFFLSLCKKIWWIIIFLFYDFFKKWHFFLSFSSQLSIVDLSSSCMSQFLSPIFFDFSSCLCEGGWAWGWEYFEISSTSFLECLLSFSFKTVYFIVGRTMIPRDLRSQLFWLRLQLRRGRSRSDNRVSELPTGL